MAKRTIQECDLSKEEYDPKDTVTIVIKRAGKKNARTYELSPASAEKLETQLVSGQALGSDWSFRQRPMATSIVPQTEESNLDDSVDDELQEKIALAKAQAQSVPEEHKIKPDAGCLHINKSRPYMAIENGKSVAYRICQDCRGKVPIHKISERNNYLKEKAPEDPE